jgi:pimeloyl-ACP methyl ester carboxylesterase
MLDVLDFMTVVGIADAAVIGTSRGGIIAILMAAAQPTAIGAVVLNDIGPVIGTMGFCASRRVDSSDHGRRGRRCDLNAVSSHAKPNGGLARRSFAGATAAPRSYDQLSNALSTRRSTAAL